MGLRSGRASDGGGATFEGPAERSRLVRMRVGPHGADLESGFAEVCGNVSGEVTTTEGRPGPGFEPALTVGALGVGRDPVFTRRPSRKLYLARSASLTNM
jgi:hypothetical protein